MTHSPPALASQPTSALDLGQPPKNVDNTEIEAEGSERMRVLVIEDDVEAAAYLVKGLKESGHTVDHAADGDDGLTLAMSAPYDVLVVDRMLPKRDGLSVVSTIREQGNATPVLFLSALGEVDDRIKGLKAGGDDYLTKPYAFAELLARIEVLVRRSNPDQVKTKLQVGDLEIDLLARKVTRADTEIDLQPREFRLLEYLMKNADRVVTRTMLLENVPDTRYVQQSNLLNTTTFRLALIYLALFATSAIALLGYVYWNTAGFLARQSDEAVQVEITGLAEQYAQGGLAQLVHIVIQRSRDPRQSLYLLVDPRGSVLAGNLGRRPGVEPGPDGWMDFQFNRLTMEGSEIHSARARAFPLPDGSFLLVGRDVQELRSIENLITSSLAWAIALTVALGLVGGVIISRNMLARVYEINQTSRNIIRGDLSQRVSVAGSGDEFDQLAENLNEMLEQIESLMTGMREVTDNVAHDLRSPLNRLRTRLEMAMMREGSTEEVRTELERSIADADHLLSTFNSLLAIARAETGSMRDTMTRFDLGELVHDAVELYEPVAEDAGITCTVETDEGLEIFGNRELLAQAIANLLDNAIKHGNKELPLKIENAFLDGLFAWKKVAIHLAVALGYHSCQRLRNCMAANLSSMMLSPV
ncbi:unnamed protein product [Effrenium voratum]|nr:unnamed protein product [Effrenium voratum]CAJ1414189.1 unnamed protein product [Effrenium voratum]